MTAAEVHENTEQARVESWRYEALVRAGYPDDAAAEIAARFDVDLHHATGLLQQGCPPDIALRILL